MTDRRWLRRPPGARIESRVVFDSRSRLDNPRVPADLSASDANALSAARRAITPGDLALRTHALWEAFEFYVARRPSARLFTKADREAILAVSKECLSEEQLARLGQVVYGPLNELPLMDKLAATLADEGIVLTSTDRAVLSRLRKVRNQTMHAKWRGLPFAVAHGSGRASCRSGMRFDVTVNPVRCVLVGLCLHYHSSAFRSGADHA
jgi:hypothetical protein